MYIQSEELELVNSIWHLQPYGKSWVSFFNFQSKEIQIFDPINLHIVQYIKIGQNIRDFQFSYDKSFVTLKLDNNYIIIQDLNNDIKTYYNNVDQWQTFNNEVWIEQKNRLLVIKDNDIASSSEDKISNYRFGLKFLVQKNKECHTFINICKTRLRYFLKAKHIYMKNFSSNINYWGVIGLKPDIQTSLRFLNRLYKQIKLIRKIPFKIMLESKFIKMDVISLTFETENGIRYFIITNASNGRIKRSKCGLNLQQFVITNDLKTLIYLEDEKFKICSFYSS